MQAKANAWRRASMEDPLVVPFGVLVGEDAGHAVVLAEEYDVHDGVTDRRVAMLEADREKRVCLLFGGTPQDHVSDKGLIE